MYQYMSIPGTVFGVAPNWTQPESPSMGEWFNTICYIFTLDELHAMKSMSCWYGQQLGSQGH